MSTGCECEFLEVRKDQWYYILEHYNAPKNSWDWHEHADAYGPFPSEDAAHEHLRENHANPGGSSTCALPAGVLEVDLEKDPVLKRLIAEAQAPRKSFY